MVVICIANHKKKGIPLLHVPSLARLAWILLCLHVVSCPREQTCCRQVVERQPCMFITCL